MVGDERRPTLTVHTSCAFVNSSSRIAKVSLSLYPPLGDDCASLHLRLQTREVARINPRLPS